MAFTEDTTSMTMGRAVRAMRAMCAVCVNEVGAMNVPSDARHGGEYFGNDHIVLGVGDSCCAYSVVCVNGLSEDFRAPERFQGVQLKQNMSVGGVFKIDEHGFIIVE